MVRFKRTLLANGLGLVLLAASSGLAAPQAPDNTKTNQRDKTAGQPTAGQQKDNKTDRDLTAKIRRSITQDKSFSTYARNIKIITQDGVVTLRGPVRSEEEKKSIEAKANEIAGSTHVKSELEVAPEKPSSKSNSKNTH
jgi:osmotically-inducible protein OsmY